MKINQYTVVSCNNCEEVWIVKDNPEKSQCPTCDKTRRFKLLKKYKSVDSIEKARLIRAQVKANLADSEEEFERAFEDDELVLDESFGKSSSSKSFRDIVKEAIEQYDSMEEIKDYCDEHGYSRERVEEHIQKLKQRGEILETGDTIRFV